MTRGNAAYTNAKAREYSSAPPAPSVAQAVNQASGGGGKSGSAAVERALSNAASILPAAHRDRLLADTKKKAAERKRPGAGRRGEQRQVRSAMAEERDKALIRENVRRAQAANPKFADLGSLLKMTERTAGQGLIRLNSERKDRPQVKRRKVSERDIYAGVTMTKEMREREEKERLRREQAVREERERVHEHFRQMRIREREELDRLEHMWKMEETVASGMRNSYRLARHERELFDQQEEDRQKKDSLTYLGLNIKSVGVDDLTTNLLTVEVIEI